MNKILANSKETQVVAPLTRSLQSTFLPKTTPALRKVSTVPKVLTFFLHECRYNLSSLWLINNVANQYCQLFFLTFRTSTHRQGTFSILRQQYILVVVAVLIRTNIFPVLIFLHVYIICIQYIYILHVCQRKKVRFLIKVILLQFHYYSLLLQKSLRSDSYRKLLGMLCGSYHDVFSIYY